MAEQVHPAPPEPYGPNGPHLSADWVFRRGKARIPSWLEADRSLQQEAVYIDADRFTIEDLLAIGRRTIHLGPTRHATIRYACRRARIPSRSPSGEANEAWIVCWASMPSGSSSFLRFFLVLYSGFAVRVTKLTAATTACIRTSTIWADGVTPAKRGDLVKESRRGKPRDKANAPSAMKKNTRSGLRAASLTIE